jgi:hypothetical protein
MAIVILRIVRGDLLTKLGRFDESRPEFGRAAALTRNANERVLLLECDPSMLGRFNATRTTRRQVSHLALCMHSRRGSHLR